MRLIDADALTNALVQSCNDDQTKMLPVWIEKQIDAEPTVALLFRQEAKPVIYDKHPCNNPPDAHCPKCRIAISRFIHQPSGLRPEYCPICGQAVKWDA